MATFAERLKSLRREKGWSQQRLADELDLSKSSVNMYERGEREPGLKPWKQSLTCLMWI